MSIPRRFGLESLARELLKTDDVHNLGNLLSLGTDAHTRFANLQLWFEGTDKVRCPLTSQWYQPRTYTAKLLHCRRFS